MRILRTAAYTAHLTGVPGVKLALNSTLPPCGTYFSGRVLIEDEAIGRAISLRNHGAKNSQLQREGAAFCRQILGPHEAAVDALVGQLEQQ